MHRLALVLACCVTLVPAAAGRAASGWPQPWDVAPHWSPDGRTIAFVRTWAGEYHVRFQQLVLRDVATGAEHVILELPPTIVVPFDWSPDSSRLAVGSGPRLWLVDAGSGAATVLWTSPASPACCMYSVLWSPDGSRIAFAGPDANYVTGLTAGSARVLGFLGGKFSWSPDGSALALGAGNSVGTFNPDSNVFHVVASGLGGLVGDVEWGPRGWFAFLRSDGHLGLLSPSGAFVSFIGRGADAVWAPPGNRLAWVAGDHIESYDIDSRTHSRLGAPPAWDARGVSPPTWSPDARQIAYTGAGPCSPGIVVAQADGSQARRLTNACTVLAEPGSRQRRLRLTP